MSAGVHSGLKTGVLPRAGCVRQAHQECCCRPEPPPRLGRLVTVGNLCYCLHDPCQAGLWLSGAVTQLQICPDLTHFMMPAPTRSPNLSTSPG